MTRTTGPDWRALAGLLVRTGHQGWWLLEAGGQPPADRVAAFVRQREFFQKLMADAKA